MAWHKDDRFKDHRLTKETYEALVQSTTVLLRVIEYMFSDVWDEKPKYFLTGKLQTDQLERRFSKYRWLSGSNFKVKYFKIYFTLKLNFFSVLNDRSA